MKTELVRIGNSRGIRIPKAFIDQCGLESSVDLRVHQECLVVSRTRRPREGWEQAFRAAGSSSKDEVLLQELPPADFDRKEWTW